MPDVILGYCDGAKTVAEIAVLISELRGIPLGEAVAATALVVDYFRSEGLIECCKGMRD